MVMIQGCLLTTRSTKLVLIPAGHSNGARPRTSHSQWYIAGPKKPAEKKKKKSPKKQQEKPEWAFGMQPQLSASLDRASTAVRTLHGSVTVL